jgi:hypothetical protein
MSVLQILQGVCLAAVGAVILTPLLRFAVLFVLRPWIASGRSWILRPFFRFIVAFCALIAGMGISFSLLGLVVGLVDVASGHESLFIAIARFLALVMMNLLLIATFQLSINSALNGCLYDMHDRKMAIEDGALAGWLVRQVRKWSWLHRLHDHFRVVPYDVVVQQICGSTEVIEEIVA